MDATTQPAVRPAQITPAEQSLNRNDARAPRSAKESQFKASHWRLTFGLLCITYVDDPGDIIPKADCLHYSLFHALGIYFFIKGFLLTRLVLDDKSRCEVPPIDSTLAHGPSSWTDGCWHPKTFDKAVVIIVDALRYDFTIPVRADQGSQVRQYQNALTVFHETTVEQPRNAFLLPFIADPPTTTLQRLKGLTTGTLPTFVDAGSNFAGTAIEEDNLLAQLRAANRTLVHLGDDTWHSLFPGYFDMNLTRSYDSFNVWDLHTVDDGVTEHLFPLLSSENSSRWDVMFAHYLGVDHAGHRYGPDHPAMKAKLKQMDGIFRRVIGALDESTLLVVMGDHGMDAKGDHGGESDDEIQAALWMYSKKGVFGRSSQDSFMPPATAKERPAWQIDLVPTLALLLGLPIPFNNLGSPIQEAFIGRDGTDWANLAAVMRLAGAQIKRYQAEYMLARGLGADTMSKPLALWKLASASWDVAVDARADGTASAWTDAYSSFLNYQAETLRICRDLWARFDIKLMVGGIAFLVIGVLSLLLFASRLSEKVREPDQYLPPTFIESACLRLGPGLIMGLLSLLLFNSNATALLVVAVIASRLLPAVSELKKLGGDQLFNLRLGFYDWLAVFLTLSQSIGFASNSYTIWEDEILLFFNSTIGFLAAISSLRRPRPVDRVLGLSQSTLFVVLSRIASLARLCREEQMPYCRSTYYASTNSSTSASWQLLIPFVVAICLPEVIRSYYQATQSYRGPAVFWIGSVFRIGLLLSAIFWTLDAADDGDWFALNKETLKSAKVVMARVVLGVSLIAGTTIFYHAKPSVSVEISGEASAPSKAADGPDRHTPTVTISGSANTYGTAYLLLPLNVLLSLILLQKPMGHLSLSILIWQILCLLEFLHATNLAQSAIGPMALGMLGNYHFFKTGHQATLSSIQWEAAFIPLSTVRYPWSPLLVLANAFGPQILCTLAVPLLVLWRRPPTAARPALLRDVGRALCVFLAYHAVVNLATTMWAAWLRRHLMLYRIFSPRWMVGATVLVTCDAVAVLVALMGVRWTVGNVAEVFGWEERRVDCAI